MDNGEKEERITLADSVRSRYESANYGIAGSHSGVQVCSWTRKALRGKGVCYKQKFYGVDCDRCCQMSPALAWCPQNCVFCWRPMEWMGPARMETGSVDAPEAVIDGCVKARMKLLSGIGGAGDARKEAFARSFREFPSHWAISLSGEPTLYPLLGGLVKALRARKEVRSIFIVTNGQEPEALERLAREGALPTQLYVSLAAPGWQTFKKINRPVHADGWERLNRTLELMPSLACRRVIRLTLIKGVNDGEGHLPAYAALLEKSKADFIEVKSYMHLGLSRERLARENMPTHAEIMEWSGKLLGLLPAYRMENDDAPSRVALLKRRDSPFEDTIRKA